MSKCEADRKEAGFCSSDAFWVVKAASFKILACKVHLSPVCVRMMETGVQYMTVSRVEHGG